MSRPSEHILTVGDSSQLPPAMNGKFLKGRGEPRIAMVGRSNVGKSSLINSLLERSLAQISKQPGKTRLLHFYLWPAAGKVIADLPGYGYARASAEDRNRWAGFINDYLRQDEGLERAVVLLDARHGPTEQDREAIRFLSFESVPVTFVFAKSDTLKTQSERASRRKEAAEALRQLGFDPEGAFWVSSKTRDGLKALARELGAG